MGRWLIQTRFPNWPRTCGLELPDAQLRSTPADFRVFEQLPFTASGSGEFVLLKVEKRGLNTRDIATRIAKFARVHAGAVSYAGLKDRHAITQQYFSVHLINRPEPKWARLDDAALKILGHWRHHRKLRVGALSGNRFEIVLRQLTEPISDDRVERLARLGVPNYFGEQRFGRDGNNIDAAISWLNARGRVNRDTRSLWISTLRSLLFNEYLANRVEQDNWCRVIEGDVMMLAGSSSVFVADDPDAELISRLHNGDVHPTGPLFGLGESLAKSDSLKLEQQLEAKFSALVDGLRELKLKPARRALRLIPQVVRAEYLRRDTLKLHFTLPAGCYATVLLRELIRNTSPQSTPLNGRG